MKNKIEMWHIIALILAIAVLSQYGGNLFSAAEVSEGETEPSSEVTFNFPEVNFPEWNESAAEGHQMPEHKGIPSEFVLLVIGVATIALILRFKGYV